MKSRSKKSLKTRAHLGQLLRDARIQHRLSQNRAAHQLGLNNGQMISDIERGKSPAPLHLLRKMSRLYNLAPEKILASLIAQEKEHILRIWDS